MKKKGVSSSSSIRCYECGGKGHIKPDCPTLQGKHKKGFSAAWDQDDEASGSSSIGSGSESESGEEANLAFMAIEDSSNEVNASCLTPFPCYSSDCDSDADCENDDPIELIKELNSQCTHLHCEMVEAKKLVEASAKEVKYLKEQVEAHDE